MSVRLLTRYAVPALLALAAAPLAAQPAPAPPPSTKPQMRHADPFTARLEALLSQSRAEKRRVVLFMHGEEIAGVVLELGPGWVILSNQEDQEILLRTNVIERAEFR